MIFFLLQKDSSQSTQQDTFTEEVTEAENKGKETKTQQIINIYINQQKLVTKWICAVHCFHTETSHLARSFDHYQQELII